jgi:hypothetical protein
MLTFVNKGAKHLNSGVLSILVLVMAQVFNLMFDRLVEAIAKPTTD